MARERGINIIPIKWIYDSINSGTLQDVSDYRFKLFEGIVVTTTGFDLRFAQMLKLWLEERYTIQSEVELHGGIFERELVYDHTNYLIARNTTSEKYLTAIQWKKVIIVNEYWIQDSTRCGSRHFLFPSILELMNPSDYQNYTQPQSAFISHSATPSQRGAKDDSAVTSFTDSCLSMIQPLEKGSGGLAV